MQLKGAFKMKKFVSLLLALMMALGMTALAEESKDQLARIQEKGRNCHCDGRHLGTVDVHG